MIGPSDIEYFIEVARTGHVSRAAERIGITQPALSHALQKIERELGQTLLIRSKKGVSLTAAGERFRLSCEGILQQWKNLKDQVTSEVEAPRGRIRLGCHTAVAQYTLPHFLPQLLKEHPGLEVQLFHGLSRHVTEQVITSELDVGMAVNPVRHPDLIIKEVCRDRVMIWKTRQCLNPDVLLIEPSLLQSQDILRKIAKKGLQFSRILESHSLEVLAQLMMAGTGCAILPERVVRAFSQEEIPPVKNSPVFEDQICLIFKREFAKLARGKLFIQTVGAASL